MMWILQLILYRSLSPVWLSLFWSFNLSFLLCLNFINNKLQLLLVLLIYYWNLIGYFCRRWLNKLYAPIFNHISWFPIMSGSSILCISQAHFLSGLFFGINVIILIFNIESSCLRIFIFLNLNLLLLFINSSIRSVRIMCWPKLITKRLRPFIPPNYLVFLQLFCRHAVSTLFIHLFYMSIPSFFHLYFG